MIVNTQAKNHVLRTKEIEDKYIRKIDEDREKLNPRVARFYNRYNKFFRIQAEQESA